MPRWLIRLRGGKLIGVVENARGDEAFGDDEEIEQYDDELVYRERLAPLQATAEDEPTPADDLATLAEAVALLLSSRMSAEAQALRQRVAEIVQRRRR